MSTRLFDSAADRMNRLFPRMPYVIRVSYEGQSRAVGSGPDRAEMACKTRDALAEDAAHPAAPAVAAR